MDLSRNGLSDASATMVVEQIQRFDLRLDRLHLSGNGIQAAGLAKVTEYIWNCPDPLLELDLSKNQVDADPNAGPEPGSDGVSALLRCFYNHAAYPQIVTGQNGAPQVLPLTLRLGHNRVKEPARLLKSIEAKGGKKHVKIRPSPDPYDHTGKEYLSVCLPEFLVQAAPAPEAEVSRDRPRKRHRSRSGHGHPKVTLKPAAEAAKGSQKPEKHKKSSKAEKAAEQVTPKPEKHKKSSKGEKTKKSKRKEATTEEPEHWRPASPQGSSSPPGKRASSHRPEKAKKSKREAKVATATAGGSSSGSEASGSPSRAATTTAAPAAGGRSRSALVISDEDQKALQKEVGAKLASFHGLPTEDGTREMLSEFVVCMAVAGKGSDEIQRELSTFIADEAAVFVKWFGDHIQKWKRR